MISSYTISEGKIKIKTPYCEEVVATCRSWAGRFDKSAEVWIVPDTRLEAVQQLLGKDIDDQVEVEVEKKDWKGYAQIRVGWFVLAGRRGRDYRADIYADLVAGTIPSSGGSVKNPRVAESDDARFRLWVPRDFAVTRELKIVTDPHAAEPVAEPINPLAQYSDEDIRSEFVRRGLAV
jgi:hypothetical protein